ncbi:MAG: ArsJ-associated glyceraldehyde-3-phosphate dehydrogenase [Pseudomonadota bacterium]
MTINVGINGFGRIGRLAVRAALNGAAPLEKFKFQRVNDPSAPANTQAHLLNFDSVHGIWDHVAQANEEAIIIDRHTIQFTQNSKIEETDWSDCDLVIDASGQYKSISTLQPYFEQGVKKVLVCAPVKETGALNIVMGVNDHLYSAEDHNIITAASCTTNCIAPAVKVIQQNLGIRHGSITTVHDITNTQSILDQGHKDLRRARACGMSLIPTTTGSATAIAEIFPELRGKLNGHAIRVPLANASLTDSVFEVETPTTIETVNGLFAEAAAGDLSGILGYEERPLVSIDYRTDPRSCIVDAPSTTVVNGTQLKLYLWYDNEWGYANRVIDLVKKVISQGI